MAAAGPAAGAVASLVAVGVGLALSAGGSGGIQFEAGAFDDSLLIGGLGARAHPYGSPPAQAPQSFISFTALITKLLLAPTSTTLAACASLQWEGDHIYFCAHSIMCCQAQSPCTWSRGACASAGAGRLVLGDRLLADSVNLSPVLTAGWAGLIVNALNCLPVGGSPWQACPVINRQFIASSRC